MQRNAGLTTQSLTAALGAAYVGVLVSYMVFQVRGIQTNVDAFICPFGPREMWDGCTIGELSLAFLFDFLWALYGLPFAFVLTAPCAVGLGRLSPRLEQRLAGRSLALAQYGLGASLGLVAGALIGEALAGLAAACAAVWIFRWIRYRLGPLGLGAAEQSVAS